MDQLDERMAGIEASLAQLDKRLTEWINHFSNEIGQLRSEMRSEIGQLRSEMGSAIRELRSEIGQLRLWMFGILIPMWVSIILTILFMRSIR